MINLRQVSASSIDAEVGKYRPEYRSLSTIGVLIWGLAAEYRLNIGEYRLCIGEYRLSIAPYRPNSVTSPRAQLRKKYWYPRCILAPLIDTAAAPPRTDAAGRASPSVTW